MSENDKQYETKRAWIFLQSWLVGNKGVLKGGGFNYSSSLNFFLGKVKKRYKEDEKWGGREVVVAVNIFSRGDIFSGGVEIFSGEVVEKFSRRAHVGNPPPGNVLLVF